MSSLHYGLTDLCFQIWYLKLFRLNSYSPCFNSYFGPRITMFACQTTNFQSTLRITDLGKRNLVEIRNDGSDLGAPVASNNETRFKSGQNRLENNHLDSKSTKFIIIRTLGTNLVALFGCWAATAVAALSRLTLATFIFFSPECIRLTCSFSLSLRLNWKPTKFNGYGLQKLARFKITFFVDVKRSNFSEQSPKW